MQETEKKMKSELIQVSQIMTSQNLKSTKPLCPDCLKKGIETITSFVNLPDNIKSLTPVALLCPACNDDLKAYEKNKQDELVKKQEKNKKESLLSFSNLGSKYEESCFENLESGIKGQNDSIIWAKRFKNRIINKSPEKISIYLYGVTGNGKTELQACAFNELEKAGFNCLFTTLGKLFGAMHDYENVKELEIYNIIRKLDAFFIDDFGAEELDKKSKSWFFEIFDIIDKYEIPVFISSNFSDPSQIVPDAKSEKAQSKEDMKIRRVISRLIGKIDIVENYSKDYRWIQAQRRLEKRKMEVLTEF